MLYEEIKQIWLKKKKRDVFKIILQYLRGPRTDVQRDACTEEQVTWRIIYNVYFTGD